MPINDVELYYPKTKKQWRQWLAKNHVVKDAVWVIRYKKSTGKPTVSWSDSVDEALCFGWIDSVHRKLDDERSMQYFSKRKPKSTWSKINKEKVGKLLAAGLMTRAGMDCIAIAKQNGAWKLLDTVDDLLIPADLESGLKARPMAMDYFLSLSDSSKKAMLQWLVLARRPETRQKRIDEIARLAAQGLKPKQF